ncbi:hypothetical protein R1sor_015394 [Riccia sorocarpa]|uniref:Serine aminopeptidase S33 domain-containing protein n=1 Tax=Riccia sorocarpa TaxID=122646 RepID=A0ABD3HC41_9MARC
MEVTGVQYQEANIVNNRGVKQFVCSWLPASQEPRALVFMCHGYGMECSVFMRDNGERLARAGFAVYGIDYEGHGKSSGKKCYIPSFANLVGDCTSYFMGIQDREEYKGKPSFLYGESMGGAVALLVSRKEPLRWNGMVLVAPMCKIAPKMRPHPIVITTLSKLASVIPTWKIVPGGDVYDLAFKVKEKREKIRANKLLYHGKPRVRTALEMYRASCDLEARLDEVTLPFLVLHGAADMVTEPSVSEALYKQATSQDKEFKLYEGLWHGLTAAESDEDVDMVFTDIINWLNERSSRSSSANVSSSSSPIRQSDLSALETDTKYPKEVDLKGDHDELIQTPAAVVV